MTAIYKLTKAVADIVTSIDNTVIFGGYVRDTILHDYMAQQYYKHPSVCSLSSKEKNIKYSDPNFLPEFKDRTLIAKDIDCFMSTDNIDKFEKLLNEKKLHVNIKKERDISNYITEKNMFLTYMEIGFDISPILETLLPFPLRKIFVSVDIVHCSSIMNKEPPFNNIDFECNALIIDSSKQIRISTKLCNGSNINKSIIYKLEYMLEIINGIYVKKTKAVSDNIDFLRIIKMTQKGYTLTGRDNAFELKNNIDNKEICPICIDTIKYKSKFKIKRTCCSATYHVKCLHDMINHNNFNQSCPLCRNQITHNEIYDNQMLWSDLITIY